MRKNQTELQIDFIIFFNKYIKTYFNLVYALEDSSCVDYIHSTFRDINEFKNINELKNVIRAYLRSKDEK